MSSKNTYAANNIAYIDGANLYKGVEQLGWSLDYARFQVWLCEKYAVQKSYLFIGRVPKYANLYKNLEERGFTLIFKDIIYDSDGKVKGNCDADLIVQVMRDVYETPFDKVILVSSDGDYASLVSFLIEKKKILTVLSPYETTKCSLLLKRTSVSIAYLSDQKSILQMSDNKKAPDADRTA